MMRIAFGLLVYLGLCLGEFAHFLSALHLKRCSRSSPPISLSSGVHYHDLWMHKASPLNVLPCFFSSSYNRRAIHWNIPWVGSRGRRCDPQMFARRQRTRYERCHKLRLVLKQWVSRSKEILLIFPSVLFPLLLPHPKTRAEICFIFLSFSSLPVVLLRIWLPPFLFCRTNDDAEADKKVINGEHFVKIGNELLIRNAVKHLTGYYSCVVEFEDSGAKLETPHELINIIGEYPTSLCAICWQRMHNECAFPIKTLPFAQRAGGEKAIIDTSRAPQQTLQGVGKFH